MVNGFILKNNKAMNPNMLRVIGSQVVSDGNGGVAIICDIVDGSQWKCSEDGSRWEMIKPSHQILTDLFLSNKPSDDSQLKNPNTIFEKNEEKKSK